jgi:hypothetical protein
VHAQGAPHEVRAEGAPDEVRAEGAPDRLRGTTSEPAPERIDAPHPVRWRDGRLIVGDPDGPIEIIPAALLQFDAYGFAGRGVSDFQRPNGTGLQPNLNGRRIRIELGGRVRGGWFFLFGMQGGGEGGTNVSPLNNFVGWEADLYFRVQAGQFRVPFTMDNVTGIRWGEFLERTLVARAIGAPLVRDLGVMIHGGNDESAFVYALGVFGGEGGNRPSTDARGDLVARLVVRPLSTKTSAIRQLHVGGSARYGSRDPRFTQYDVPALGTPGGYAFWSPVSGTGPTEIHVQPRGLQRGLAAEIFVPWSWFDLRGEIVTVDDGRREVLVGSRDATERAGSLRGTAWYAQATLWPWGPARPAGPPGIAGPFRTASPGAQALGVALRYEQLRADYDSTTVDPAVARGSYDPNGRTRIAVDALQAAVVYWATAHVKLVAQYSLFSFPGGSAANQAVAPGERASAPDARTLHEFALRMQLSL